MSGQIKLKVGTKQPTEASVTHDKKITIEDVNKIVDEKKKATVETSKKISIASKSKENPPTEKVLSPSIESVGPTTSMMPSIESVGTTVLVIPSQQTTEVVAEEIMGRQIITFIIDSVKKVNINTEVNGKGFWVNGDVNDFSSTLKNYGGSWSNFNKAWKFSEDMKYAIILYLSEKSMNS